MSDPTTDFFEVIVRSAIEEYEDAEKRLTAAVAAGDEAALGAARQLVLRRGRTAAIELHQFADQVHADKPAWGPTCATPNAVRKWLKDNWCANPNSLIDFDVLHAVADAFKHAVLTQGEPLFRSDEVIVTTSMGYGEGRYGVGKWGGTDQLTIEIPGLETPMSTALQVVSQAWLKAMGSVEAQHSGEHSLTWTSATAETSLTPAISEG